MDSPKLRLRFNRKVQAWRYQLELGQKALEENIIVCLGTGSPGRAYSSSSPLQWLRISRSCSCNLAGQMPVN
ncbi:hypothetical protein CMV_014494 [Castanea mollissima]|uniref:Uncharacterized protein n=1 Tax=Castanea mollissima TaxID=60419 RepID=A0A8J4R3Q2_9ROSI|nr:hypothetical protein CMV_014494 [Castanea mollissima]